MSIGQGLGSRGNMLLPPLGIIEVIHATSIGVSISHILSVMTPLETETTDRPEKKPRMNSYPIIFDEANLKGMLQPHDDALLVTSRIGGFLVKRVMIDQGNRAKVMYPDLYKGLGLKAEDLSKYNTLLVGFDGKVVLPEGQIKLSVVIKGKEVEVNFVVVNAFSSYTAILGRP